MQGDRRGPVWLVVVLGAWGCLSALGLGLSVLDGGATAREVAIGVGVSAVALAGAWFVARPRGEAEPRGDGTVVARAAWWLRLGGLLAGVGGLGLWGGLLGLVGSGPDTVTLSGGAGTAASIVIGVVASALLLTACGTWRFRQTLDEREATSRVLVGTTRIDREGASGVRLVTVDVHAGRAGGRLPVTRIVVEGPDQRGVAARAGFDATMTGPDRALEVLDQWVRSRPALVADEATRALFRARGVLPD